MRWLFKKMLTEVAGRMCSASPISPKFKQIDPTLSITTFWKSVKDMSKCQLAVLVQLRTEHIALNKHLNRIGKTDTRTHPSAHVAYERTRRSTTSSFDAQHTRLRGEPWYRLQDMMPTTSGGCSPDTILHLLEYVGATKRFARQCEG